jgi:hypothetical protein
VPVACAICGERLVESELVAEQHQRRIHRRSHVTDHFSHEGLKLFHVHYFFLVEI